MDNNPQPQPPVMPDDQPQPPTEQGFSQPIPPTDQGAPQPVQPGYPAGQAVPPPYTPQSTQPGYPAGQAVPPPYTPQPVAQPAAYAAPSAPGKSSSKNLIIALSIAGGLVLIGVIVVIVIVMLLTVSREDYAMAANQMNEVRTAASATSSDISSVQYGYKYNTDTEFNNNVDKMNKSLIALKDESAKLGELKAMQLGEGKEKYAAFDSKVQAFIEYSESVGKSLIDLRKTQTSCDTSGVSTTEGLSELNSSISVCLSALRSIESTPDKNVQEYITEYIKLTEDLQRVVSSLSGISDPYGSQYDQYTALRDQLYKIQDRATDLGSDYISNSEKRAREVDVKNEANALIQFLDSKM